MKEQPKITVILGVYNGKKYLAEAIESILNQTFKNFEFIIIDDYSKDNSLKIIKDYMKKDLRITLIKNKKNLGLTKSLNKGLKIAKGKYIARMDSDDVALPKRLEVQYNFLEQNKNIFLIGGGAIHINEEGKQLGAYNPIWNINKIKARLLTHNCFCHPTIMFRKEKGIKYNEKFLYAQDYDFYLNLLSNGKKLTNIKDVLIKYRINSKSISFSKRAKQFLFSKKAKEFYYQRLNYGKDDSDLFNPKEILNFETGKREDIELLKVEARANFVLEDYEKSIKFCKKYIKINGFFNKVGIYYILSGLSKNSKLFHKFNQFLLRMFG